MKKLIRCFYLSVSVALITSLSPGYAAESTSSLAVRQAAIASAHPLATQAGLAILKQGGNAFDAAIAVTATLAVVEPYSSGIGGGGFYLLNKAGTDDYVMLDARETAPLAADKNLYLDESGEVIPGVSINGPLAAGIPGIPAALAHLAETYGNLKLTKSLAPAIALARSGFTVDEYYRRMASFRLKALRQNKAASEIFLDKGEVPESGYRIVQKDLAATLAAIAESGAAGFYKNSLAAKLVGDVQRHGGIWTLKDLAAYQLKQREPEVINYRGMRLVSASLPSSGGLVLSEILGMLAQFELDKVDRVQRIHLIVEAMRRAYRDRAEYMGDPDFVEVPSKHLLSDAYIRSLAASISTDRATPSLSLKSVAQPSGKGADTTHFSVIDGQGNKVSATLSINYPFGSCFVARGTGVLLNDEMDDFSAKPGMPNIYGLVGSQANAIAPGKRMLSSMTPSIVESENRIAIIGTPGGSRIITMVLLGILDFYENKSAEDIVNAGRYHHQYLPDEIAYEPGAFDEATVMGLEEMGHTTRAMDSTYGNMQLIIVDKNTGMIEAASDGRAIGSAKTLP